MFKKIWKKINGKKTVAGLLTCGAGIIMFNFPFTAPAAPFVLDAGLVTLGIGIGSKVEKKVDTNKED